PRPLCRKRTGCPQPVRIPRRLRRACPPHPYGAVAGLRAVGFLELPVPAYQPPALAVGRDPRVVAAAGDGCRLASARPACMRLALAGGPVRESSIAPRQPTSAKRKQVIICWRRTAFVAKTTRTRPTILV